MRASFPARVLEPNLQAFHAGRALQAVNLRELPLPTGSPRRYQVEVNAAWCKGRSCGICVRVCPEEILGFGEHDRVTVLDPARCTGCQLCQLLCPDFAVVVREEAVLHG